MEPFNIKVGYGEREVTLTILPTDGYYKVIYYAGILGAIRYDHDAGYWEIVPPEELPVADLPNYVHDLSSDRLEIVLTDETVAEIGNEIELYLLLSNETDNYS